jgi:hypothetical protein
MDAPKTLGVGRAPAAHFDATGSMAAEIAAVGRSSNTWLFNIMVVDTAVEAGAVKKRHGW